MDGNNRWSLKKNYTKYQSYLAGANTLLKSADYIFRRTETKYISAFALSKNNLNRSKVILNSIRKVLLECLESFSKNKSNFDIEFIGDYEIFGNEIKRKIIQINDHKKFKQKLVIFLNYGGREDIIESAKVYGNKKKKFENLLKTKNIPDPDLLIRTGGFKRLSNFFLYQIAFTDLFFLDKLWPDLNTNDIKKIIDKFRNLERKFGK